MINVPYRTAGGNSFISIESHLLMERKIFLQGNITQASACECIQKLMYLKAAESDKKIRIYINSYGGEVDAGLMIYDAIKGLEMDIEIICVGIAASMAAIILASGQKGKRFILPHSKVMIHEPLIGWGAGGSATTIQKTAESILEVKRITAELLAKDTGKTVEQIEKAISFDNFMNAEQAVDFGICDKIITNVFEGGEKWIR